jgi:hypothetical protein
MEINLKNARKNCDCPNGGKRKRGGPQKRRTDEAEEDPEIEGVSNSRTVARDWKDWRTTVLEGEVRNGLQCTRRRKKIQKVCFHTAQPYSPVNACGVIFI